MTSDHEHAAQFGLMLYQTLLLHRIASNNHPGGTMPRWPTMMILLGACILFSAGCVQTKFTHGTTTIQRTSILTRVRVPSLTIATNGTITAAIDSSSQTELIEAVLRALASAPK